MARKLTEYERKRDFETTSEPAPKRRSRKQPAAPRFVIQEHHARRLHWDLRLERDGALASWAVPNGIPDDPQRNRKAVRTEDHPLEYLDFEGEIPRGEYGAGTMRVWDRGTYEVHKFRDDEVMVTFHGERVRGRYVLFRAGREPKDWMIHRMDPPERAGRDPMPERVVPMLAKLGPLPRDEERYGFEVKWDGVRAIAYAEPGRLRLQSRNLNDITARYPEVRGLARELGARTAVLDGEVVAFDEEGRPSFERLQRRMHLASDSQVRRQAKANPVAYVIFDLLHLDGESLMSRPYAERRARLEELGLDGPGWQTPRHRVGDGAALLAATAEQGLEGVIAKRLDSPYEPEKRSGAWIKVKNLQRAELWIGGWLPGEGRRTDRIGALVVGRRDEEGRLRYVGRVGTGFKEQDLAALQAKLKPLRRKTSPFEGRQPPRGAVFVEPRLQAIVEFREWTASGTLRAPSYKGLREPSVRGDQLEVDGRTIKVSNRDKVLYPRAGFTKGDVIDYYLRAAPVLLPHLQGRPLTLKRYPDGVESQHFYEKQCPSHRPDWVATVSVPSRGRGHIDYCLANDAATLAWLGNLADLELHTSLSRAEAIDRPTTMVFDLDPGPGADVLDCAEVALWLHGTFEQLGLRTFVKTSGSKGLHAQVPLNTDVTYDETKPFARAVAELMEKTHPERVVSRMTKSLRAGRVLVDWSQNDEHKTTVCAYSLRARERPTVSTPVEWEELDAALDAGDAGALTFEAGAVLERVADRGDPLADAVTLRQELPKLATG
ncbi:MAG: DNA ligase D [Actinobacteria bacterium]|nr:MAG: DNA ligase D [Actinomycetota bacterium]